LIYMMRLQETDINQTAFVGLWIIKYLKELFNRSFDKEKTLRVAQKLVENIFAVKKIANSNMITTTNTVVKIGKFDKEHENSQTDSSHDSSYAYSADEGVEVGEGLSSETGDSDVSANERVVAMEGSPGSSGSILCSDVVCLHNIQLKFDFAVLRSSVEEVFGKRARCRYVEESRQHVCRLEWSGRKLTLLFNERSGGQIFLKASDNPLTPWEFVAFAEYFLPGIFTALTGRLITPRDFYIVRPPELNIDLPGVYIGDVKMILLSDYLMYIRVYLKKINDARITRVEAWSEELAGQELAHLIRAVKTTMSMSEMIKFFTEDAEKREELKKEEACNPEKTAQYNAGLGRGFESLPEDLQKFLRILSRPEYAYVRLRYDAVEFGESYWQGMRKCKYNFGVWLKEELLVWPENLRPVLRSIFTAIYFYNRQFANKGVPWDLWYEEFKRCLEDEGLSLEEAIDRIRRYLEK